MNRKRYAVILAAGKGSRMKSELPKVLHEAGGKTMVSHVKDAAAHANVDETIVIVGHKGEKVVEHLGDSVTYAVQSEQLGTGHAVKCAADILQNESGTTLVLCGDTPLITSDTLKKLLEYHESTDSFATILTTNVENPTGYGRILRGAYGDVFKVVEEKDANNEEKKVNEINSGIYCFDNASLFQSLEHLKNDNAQGEYYLPDVIGMFVQEKKKVSAFTIQDEHEILGVNDRDALQLAHELIQQRQVVLRSV